MLFFIFKVILSGLTIAFASWLSIKKPSLAGFIIALPLMSIISILFSYIEHKNFDKTILFVKSIFVGIPTSLLFFIPFFFSKYIGMNFLTTYISGFIFLIFGYFIHKYITNFFWIENILDAWVYKTFKIFFHNITNFILILFIIV